MTENNARHYCSLVLPPQLSGSTEAALLRETKWDVGGTVKVRFLEGAPSLTRRVRDVAEEWTGEKMANLSLRFVNSGPADIRIAFVQGDGSWSYLGTVSRQITPSEQTMNYGWLTPESSDDELRRVVLHEFGHALGLIHEHQNPNRPIAWDREAVIADLSGPPNYWSPDTIEHNIFERYEPRSVSATPTDPDSIMMYPIPARWTTDGFSADLNSELAESDKNFIRDAYPW